MEVNIRKAHAGDAGSIAEFLRALGRFTHTEAESAKATQERVNRRLALCIASDNPFGPPGFGYGPGDAG